MLWHGKIQSRLAAIICEAPTKVADKRAAELHRVEKKKAKLEESERSLAATSRDEDSHVALAAPEDKVKDFYRLGGLKSTELHASHRFDSKRGVVWCCKCGKFATTRGRALLKPCTRVANESGQKALKRVRRGLTPHSSATWPESEIDSILL